VVNKKLVLLLSLFFLLESTLAVPAPIIFPSSLNINATYGVNHVEILVYNSFPISNINAYSTDFASTGGVIPASSVLVYPSQFSLDTGEVKNVSINITILSSASQGVYAGNITLTNLTYSSTLQLILNLQPGPKVIDYIPKARVQSNSLMLQVYTDKKAVCKYSRYSNMPYDPMEGYFDDNFETIHRKTMINLEDGVYRFYVKCKDENNIGEEKEVSFSIISPIAAQITLPQDILKAGKFKINLVASKAASQTPSLSYTFDGVSYSPIPLTGSGTQWIGYLIISPSLGETEGSFKFSGKDLEGNTGSDITSGMFFGVDTSKPKTIGSIEAIGYEGAVKLNWYFDEEDASFNVYKSTSSNVGYTDFCQSVTDKSFYDTSVEKGKSYYYRVSAVDEAGNEGDLSREVYATALLKNSTQSASGLDQRLISLVDNVIVEIDSMVNDAASSKSAIQEEGSKEKNIFLDLRADKDIDNAVSELSALKKDVEKYKLQDLAESELNNKLDSARIRINVIKKKIPESLAITEEKSETKEVTRSDIETAVLEFSPDIADTSKEKIVQDTLQIIKDKAIKIQSTVYNLDLIYLDGTKNEICLVRKDITTDFDSEDSLVFIEIIPKDISETASAIDFKNLNYDVIKDDPVISFSSDTKKIIYRLEKKISLNSMGNIKTIPMLMIEENQTAGITGFFSWTDIANNRNYIGVSIGVLIIIFLIIYFLYIKKKVSDNFLEAIKKINEAERLVSQGNPGGAEKIYDSILSDYKNLSDKEKTRVYPEISSLSAKIKFCYVERGLEKIKDKRGEEALLLLKEIEKIYSDLPQESKQKLSFQLEKAKKEVEKK
jgi:hypothetical protein